MVHCKITIIDKIALLYGLRKDKLKNILIETTKSELNFQINGYSNYMVHIVWLVSYLI